jgi:lipoteichoic acid synthase
MTRRTQFKRNAMFSAAFFALNILNTYFLTNGVLNRYIAPFTHTFEGEMNAIAGNLAVLLSVFALTGFLFSNQKKRMKALIVVTLVFNALFFLFSIFTMYYGTSFTTDQFSMFRNPSGGFVLGVIGVALLELVVYWRIVLFLPTIVLIILYAKSEKDVIEDIWHPRSLKKALIAVFATILLLFSSVSRFIDLYTGTLPVEAVRSTFALQNLGVYPFYAAQFMGIDPDIDMGNYLGIDDEQDLLDVFDPYNKNVSSYVNNIDGQTYGNSLSADDTFDGLEVDPSLPVRGTLDGIFKDKNLVLVHMESFNHFLLELVETRERLPFLEALLSESVVFSEYYTTVGMGVSSDAEFSVLTGLYPTGHQTIYWEYEDHPYSFSALPTYFNNEGYDTLAIHGDAGMFYNRVNVYDSMIPFDGFYTLEDYVDDGYVIKDGYLYDEDNTLVHHNPWISDYHLADHLHELTSSAQGRFFMLPIMMMPHTPYEYDPYGDRKGTYPMWEDEIGLLTLRYLNYLDYYDEVMTRFFIGPDGTDRVTDDTVYIFYSDHGSGIKNGDLDTLYGRTLSVLETRKILQHTLAFIYAPGETTTEVNGFTIREGLIKGEQTLVRSHVDLFRTVVETFGLPVGSNPYFGVNGLSKEPTFAIENRLMDVITDDLFFSMINPMDSIAGKPVNENLLDRIVRFKVLSDYLLYETDMQHQLNRAYARRSD